MRIPVRFALLACSLLLIPPRRAERRSRRSPAAHPDLDRHPARRPPARLRLHQSRHPGHRRIPQAVGAFPGRLHPLAHDPARPCLHALRAPAHGARRAGQHGLLDRRAPALAAADPQAAGLCHGRRRVLVRAAQRHRHGRRLRLLRGRDRLLDRRQSDQLPAPGHGHPLDRPALARRQRRQALVLLLPHLRAARPLQAARELRPEVPAALRRRGGLRRRDRGQALRRAETPRPVGAGGDRPHFRSRRRPGRPRRRGPRRAALPLDAPGAAAAQAPRRPPGRRHGGDAGPARRSRADLPRAGGGGATGRDAGPLAGRDRRAGGRGPQRLRRDLLHAPLLRLERAAVAP